MIKTLFISIKSTDNGQQSTDFVQFDFLYVTTIAAIKPKINIKDEMNCIVLPTFQILGS